MSKKIVYLRKNKIKRYLILPTQCLTLVSQVLKFSNITGDKSFTTFLHFCQKSNLSYTF